MVTLGSTRKLKFVALGLGLAFLLSSCSISDSVGSISDSSGSFAKSSESISDSSTSSSKDSEKAKKADTKLYEREVEDFTVTYLRTNSTDSDQEAFMKGISDVASQNGIVDWEANPITYRAIGKGLRKARISGTEYESFKIKISEGDKGKLQDIQEGYDY
jgi:hypothetical protein